MEAQETGQLKNPLESAPLGALILKYSLPAIASSLVNSIYNVVDQIFVGNSVGELGNAATNVVFPLVLIVVALAMTFGVGGASAFSLYLGSKEEQKAKSVAGTSLTLTLLTGVVLAVLTLLFLRPILTAFGGRGQTLEYAIEYTRIVAFGTPLAMLGTGASQLIRADGSPRYAMLSTTLGAVLNAVLDPILIFGFDLGMSGAAWATVIGQLVSSVLILRYFGRFQSVTLERRDYLPRKSSVLRILKIGIAAGAMQFASTVISIVMNNVLGYYGELSPYGRDIPLACVGIITKVAALFDGVSLGIAQSMQPIIGYNYGAGNYDRIKTAFRKVGRIIAGISFAAFLCFQLFPHQITAIFGGGDAMYFAFAARYFRIHLFCTFIVGPQLLCTQFFPSIGKGGKGVVVSLLRRVFLLLPMLLIFPLFLGIDGVLWAGPVADGLAGVISLLLVRHEMKKW
ncbi:MAG: MATE family efflux transporter [Clostridiales bacterium]|nr:MATE family efflux transporter [Clostridiales bacterium]